MGICGGLVGPKRGKVKKVLVFKTFFEGVKRGPATPTERTAERDGGLSGHPGVAFWYMMVVLGHFGSTS